MEKITAKQKFFLICLGLILFIILSEIALQITSAIITHETKPVIETSNDTITILTLGESTTASKYHGIKSWPLFLEEILNNQSDDKKFVVINRARSSAITDELLNTANESIAEYRPDIVISMMGINDMRAEHDPILKYYYSGKLITKSRLVKVVLLAISNANTKHQSEGDVENYTRIRTEFIKSYPTENITDEEYNLLNEMKTETAYNPGDFYKLADYHLQNQNCDKAMMVLDESSKIRSSDKKVLYLQTYECYKLQGKFNNFEEFIFAMTEKYNDNDRLFDLAAEHFKESDNPKLEAEFSKKAMVIRVNTYYTVKKNYNLLYDNLKEENVQLIAMQYPTMDIEFLEIILTNNHDVIFVSNKENFNEALSTLPYNELFVDSFAGRWGHCTEKGNMLIANNVAEVILNQEIN